MSQEPSKSSKKDLKAVDYHDEVDLARLHGSLQREHRDPMDGMEPVPLWLIAVFGVALFWGGAYLMIFSGGFRGDVFDERETSWALFTRERDDRAVADRPEDDAPDLMAIGQRFYTANCAACHQSNGMGAGEFPPLVGTEWVLGSSERLALILLHGMEGPMTVLGREYNGVMPAWNHLNDERLAGILTYIRTSWGNDAYEISPAAVAYARDKHADRRAAWTAEELLAIPEDASIMAAVEDATEAEPEADPEEVNEPEEGDAEAE